MTFRRQSRFLIVAALASAVVAAGTASGRAQLGSGGPLPTLLVPGSAAGPPSAVTGDAPVVLRGSRPAQAPPGEQSGCPPGTNYEPGVGCVSAEPATEAYAYDNGYWPYFGFDGDFTGANRRKFRHHLAGARIAHGFHSVGHLGGMGRR